MTKPGMKRETAGELLARLQADPSYRQMIAEQDAALEQRREESRIAQRHLVNELRTVGIHVDSVWDLVNAKSAYPRAIPILLQHVEQDYIPGVREGIARALAVPEASRAWDRLRALFVREPDGQRQDVKFALALAVVGAAPKGSLDTLLELIRDPSLGSSRLACVRPLLRSRNPRALETLEQLREDPDLAKELHVRLGQRAKRLQRRRDARRS
jgi:hypothetical protein